MTVLEQRHVLNIASDVILKKKTPSPLSDSSLVRVSLFPWQISIVQCCLHASLESILPVTLMDLPHLTAYETPLQPFLMKNYMVLKALT